MRPAKGSGGLQNVLDMLYGPIYHRMLVPYRGADLSDSYVDALVEAVFAGIET